MKSVLDWMADRWQPPIADKDLADTCALTFSTEHGKRFLHYLMDTYYCNVIASQDPYACVAHNAQRAVIHDILQKIDQYQRPEMYEAAQVEEMKDPRLSM